MTSLALIDKATGEVLHASSSAILLHAAGLLPLDEADATALCEFTEGAVELKRIADEAVGEIGDELIARLDSLAHWTQRWDGWEVKAPSPEAGTTGYDIELLREALDELVATGVISREGAWNALEPVRPTVEVSYRLLRDVLRALDGFEVADPIFNEIEQLMLTEPELTYRLKLAGVRRLLKIPSARAAIEACAITIVPPRRQAKVRRM